MREVTKFLVILDTTKVIMSRVKRLITKLHYHDELLLMMDAPPGTTGVETLYSGAATYNYENIRDVDIPKRLKVVIQEGITVLISEYSKNLRPFLSGGGSKVEESRQSELLVLNTNQLTFELLRTLKNSYYLSCHSDKITIDCNLRRALTLEAFAIETDFSYKRPLTDLPLTMSKMEISNSIKAQVVAFELTFSEIKLILDIIDIYLEMVALASVKNLIMGTLLDREFLKSNLLHNDNPAQESQVMLLFQEPRFKDSLVNDVLLGQVCGRLLTYDPRHAITLSATRYQMRLKSENGVDEFLIKVDYLNLQPQGPIAIVKVQSLENLIVLQLAAQESIIQDVTTTF